MPEMKLWLLQRIGDTDWDEHYGFVVRATDEAGARCEALEAAGVNIDGAVVYIGAIEPEWGDPRSTTCVELTGDGDPGVVLDSLKRG